GHARASYFQPLGVCQNQKPLRHGDGPAQKTPPRVLDRLQPLAGGTGPAPLQADLAHVQSVSGDASLQTRWRAAPALSVAPVCCARLVAPPVWRGRQGAKQLWRRQSSTTRG